MSTQKKCECSQEKNSTTSKKLWESIHEKKIKKKEKTCNGDIRAAEIEREKCKRKKKSHRLNAYITVKQEDEKEDDDGESNRNSLRQCDKTHDQAIQVSEHPNTRA